MTGIEDILNSYKNKIYRLALSISKNEKDAEDIVQNTFLKIFNNIKKFRFRSRLSTWIYKIAYNEALMTLRKKYRRFGLYDDKRYIEEIPSGLFINWARFPSEQLLDMELKERLESAIRHMPIKYRMPLLLTNVEDFSMTDTANILGLKMNSLKTRLHRARLLIKSEISGYFRDVEEKEEKEDKRCGLYMGFLYHYAEGDLDEDRKGAFKEHIKDCTSCNIFLDKYLDAIKITKALECNDIPNEFKKRLETFLTSSAS